MTDMKLNSTKREGSMKYLSTIVIAASLLLGGCSTMTTKQYAADGKTLVSETAQPGSLFGPSSYDVGYQGMYKAFEQGKSANVKTLSDASSCPQEDKVAQAYCIALGKTAGMVASMQEFRIKAPTTGFDVLNTGMDKVAVPVVGFLTNAWTAAVGIKNAGSKFGNNANVVDSMNHTQSTALAAQNGSASAPAYGTQPAQEPTVVSILPEGFSSTK